VVTAAIFATHQMTSDKFRYGLPTSTRPRSGCWSATRGSTGVELDALCRYPATMRSACLLLTAALILAGCHQQQAFAVQDDEQPRYSSLDEVAGMSRELLTRPAPAPAAVIDEPPAAGRWLVVSVHDGDTVLCLDQGNSQQKIRLVGIDAPETGQAFGTKSRDALRALVLEKSVTVHVEGEDRYGRLLGSLEIDGDDVALRMLTAGLAWHFKRFSDDEELAAAERNARAARRGLWADPEPVPPWEWRASEKERKAAQREPAGR
jgi:endonuclease YncB( thermonuclease family)